MQNEDDFRERPAGSVLPYAAWATAICLGLGAFLYADGYFDDIVRETTQAVETIVTPG